MTQTSKEYAEALFELALQKGDVPAFSAALDEVERAIGADPGYEALLASPAIPRAKRLKSLEDVFGGKLPREIVALMKLMVSRSHAREIGSMIQVFRGMAREHRGESIARVRSAVALTEEEKDILREKLKKTFGRTAILECSVDPSLLGGVRVEMDGRVLDGTVRARLQKIKEVMDS